MSPQQSTRNRRNTPQQGPTDPIWGPPQQAGDEEPHRGSSGVLRVPEDEAQQVVAAQQAWSGIIRLDEDDRLRAEQCADRMLKNADRHGYDDRFGDDSWDSHMVGALGEIAFAKYLGVEWHCHPEDIGGRPDVKGYEVRTIPSTGKWVYLKSKKNDRPTTRIVLVLLLHHNTAALVVGWLTAKEIKEQGTYRDPGRRGAGAWFIEDLRLLRPVERKGLQTP